METKSTTEAEIIFPPVIDGRTYLKVKIKSLASEALHIRRESSKARAAGKRALRISLDAHRRGEMRDVSRATQMVYAFLRGKNLESIEATNTDKYARAAAIARAIPMLNKYACPPELNPPYVTSIDGMGQKRRKDYLHVAERRFRKWAGSPRDCSCHVCQNVVI